MSTTAHLDVYFQIVFQKESGDEQESWVEGTVPAFLLDPSERSRPEMASTLLYELQARSRQNVDLSGVDDICAEIDGDPGDIELDLPMSIVIDRVDGEWRAKGWVAVPGYEPSETPPGEPSPVESSEKENEA